MLLVEHNQVIEALAAQRLDVQERFQGRGRAVLTASSALEYAWEGDALERLNEPSVFTSAVVRGLRSGDADRDGDQLVSVDDLYDYVFEEVRRTTSNQTPGKLSNVEGALIIARRPHAAVRLEPDHASVARAPASIAPPTPAALAPSPAPAAWQWLPAVVVAAGWIATWLVAFALASSRSVHDMNGAAILASLGWVLGSPMVAAALRWASPKGSGPRALLLALGWPTCMVIGLAAPFVLLLSAAGAALLSVAVAVAGLIAALAMAPAERPIAWDRVLVVTAGWCAGWLVSGATAWPTAFNVVAQGWVGTFTYLLQNVAFLALAAGPVRSGLAGGVLGALLLGRRLA